MRQITVGDCKKGAYVMVEDAPCTVLSISISKTGKHGHAKARVETVGIIDGKKRVFISPVDTKVQSPIVDKKTGQVISIQGNVAQIMDTKDYSSFNASIPENLQGKLVEGMECNIG